MRPILLKGHDGPLTCVKYNKDGDLLFTTCKRGRICLWYSDDGERIGTYNKHNVRCDLLASASMDYTARLWDVETGKYIREWKLDSGARCVSLALGDKRIAVLTDPSGDQPSTVHIYDTSSSDRAIQQILMPSTSRSNRALWGPLNKSIITCNEGGAIMSWEMPSGECMIERDDHTNSIPDFTFHQKDQMTLITGSADTSSILYDSVTLEPVKSYKSERPLNSAAVSPLMDHVVMGGGQSADKVTTTAGRQGKFESLFYHKIYETQIGSVRGHFGPINSLMFNPDGRSFTSGAEDGYVRIHHFDPEYFGYE